jgi:hypothetical protein
MQSERKQEGHFECTGANEQKREHSPTALSWGLNNAELWTMADALRKLATVKPRLVGGIYDSAGSEQAFD